MKIICLDLEGVLVPEIWIAFSEVTGIPEFRRTTRDESDYHKLMKYRIDLLNKHNLKLVDIQNVIQKIEPLEGAMDFLASLRKTSQFIILSDTFEEFAMPLLAKLAHPLLFCNSLKISPEGMVSGYEIRKENGKMHAVLALKGLNFRVFSAGDSYNDLDMIKESDSGCLFRAPGTIKAEYPLLPSVETYEELLLKIREF
ncbi:MAG: bifunctional phosphoserine phosphatase/homoserine phosphotransferase ThrH [Treponema sp.]|nr:bifunctional phosphoserine phosphatase/homoserine phosphotransferase ThrH [Treponema sp.]